MDTYGTFLRQKRERLKSLPAPQVAVSYYTGGDLYMFDDFQVSRPPGSRRPPCGSLYDVFVNICDDEGEHVKTMQACQDYASVGELVASPHAVAVDRGDTPSDDTEKRKLWISWAESINAVDLDARADDTGDFE